MDPKAEFFVNVAIPNSDTADTLRPRLEGQIQIQRQCTSSP